MKPWMPLVSALALVVGLAGCDGGESPASGQGDGAQPTASQPAEPASAAVDSSPSEPVASERASEAPDAASSTEAATDTPTEAVNEASRGQGEIAVEAAGETDPAMRDEGLPGETSRSDVDAILEETERRFEEASRRIDEQFEQAERQRPEGEPLPETEDMGELEASSSLPGEASRVSGELGKAEVDAILEETEQRFEEASREIEAQFQEAERQQPATSSELELDAGRDAAQ
ncbi:hypothetical protein FIU83_12835 [Halomonas sp. THAF5a]|uniref:hypothetical protein n=1 Tax=Halomonas sp. THAF5a TaxID=2587844 RepID=UPI00126957B7|nr:hypothetical protein [Halomonas sp. THAF5a]QFU02521.1 hypothetical protein FIU83_12835 [Halomonas sp. THAF5a]